MTRNFPKHANVPLLDSQDCYCVHFSEDAGSGYKV